MAQVKIQHTSMEFSDSKLQHEHDAKAIFDRAVLKGVWACTGTEAGANKSNHDLRDALIKEARAHDFYMHAHPNGDWVAVSRAKMKDFKKGYDGPFIPAKGGKASQGSHAARGIAWVQAVPQEGDLGKLTFGSVHYLTDRSEKASHTSNEPLVHGIADWGRRMGKGPNVVFLSGDANTNDKRFDVFIGRPFTTAADELKDWQGTHGKTSYIDFIASYDHDGRVKAKSFNVLDDSEFKLFGDHYLLEAVYSITELKRGAKKAVAKG